MQKLFDDYFLSGLNDLRIENGIKKYSSDISYSTGNFSKLRDKHSKLQLDSVNGSNIRMDTILERTNWPKEFFKGKYVLECGCGAGPDTEILLKLGANVIAVDLTNLETAKNNIGNNANVLFLQSSIIDLPLRKKSFDIVYCHRVLQHTPNPEETLDYILQFVKDDGAVFIHSYSDHPVQMFNWKYFMRPVTCRLNPELLYSIIRFYLKPLFYFTHMTNKFRIGRIVNKLFIPLINYSHLAEYKNFPIDFLMEYSLHDTFDALSPKYDKPIELKLIHRLAEKHLQKKYEIVRNTRVTLLRTIV